MFKKNKFQSFHEVLPLLKDIVQEDIMVSITDKDKFLGYWPGDKMSIPIKVGAPIPESDPLRATIQSKEIIKATVPAEVYGLPFKAVTYPLIDRNGNCTGAIGFAQSLEKEFMTKEMLGTIVSKMNAASQQIHGVTEHTTDIAEKAASNLASVEETTSSLQEISNFSKSLKDVTGEATELSGTIQAETEGGMNAVSKMVSAVENISSQLGEATSKFEQLQESMQSIENMVELIKSISEQTNLLALNASIEAARAGEHGRGFAVVADEVGKLATQSQKASVDITEQVGSIKQDIFDVISSVKQVETAVDAGRSNAKETEVSFGNIQSHIRNMMLQISQVDTHSENLSDMTQNIFDNTDELASDVERTATSASTIHEMVSDLTQALTSFEVDLKDTAEKIVK